MKKGIPFSFDKTPQEHKEKEHIINILHQQITNIEHAYQKYVTYNHNIIQLSKLILSFQMNYHA